MSQNIKNFIIKLQNSSEQTKKRWLIGLSAVSMILIIIFWLAFFTPTINQVATPQPEEILGIGFWQVFKTGLTTIGGSIKENAGDLFSKLSTELNK